MRVVVTGATGFVGRCLVEGLLKEGEEVTVIVRDKRKISDAWRNKVEVVQAALEQLADLKCDDFINKTADIFFHMAWEGTSGNKRADIGLQLKNVEYTCEAVKLAKRLQCARFIYAGSIMEYEAMQYVPSDNATPGMGNIYSTAKLTADFMAKTVATKEHVEFINLIISNIYGAGERSARFLNTTIRKMMGNESIEMTHGHQLYDFIYITDAVKAIIVVAKNGKDNSAYYIGNSKQRPLREYILEMKSILDSKSEIQFGKVPFIGAMLTYKEFNVERVEKLGFMPKVSFEEGIIQTRNWILEEKDEH